MKIVLFKSKETLNCIYFKLINIILETLIFFLQFSSLSFLFILEI